MLPRRLDCTLLTLSLLGSGSACSDTQRTRSRDEPDAAVPVRAAPDCSEETCTGERRWRVELSGEGVKPPTADPVEDPSKEPDPVLPTLTLGEVAMQSGVVAFATGGVDTAIAGEQLLSEAVIAEHSGLGSALVWLDGEGALLDHMRLPLTPSGETQTWAWQGVFGRDGNYLLVEESAADHRAYALRRTAGELTPLTLPEDIVNLAWEHDLWLTTPPEANAACKDSAQAATLEHWSSDHARVVVCQANVSLLQLTALEGGGIAALAYVTPLDGVEDEDVQVDLGAGSQRAEPYTLYLAKWSASGELAWAERVAKSPSSKLQRGPNDELWVFEPAATAGSWRRFDGEGKLAAEGKLPYPWTEIAYRVDSAGFILALGWQPPTSELTLLKLSPEGKEVWKQTVGEPGGFGALALDHEGHSYVVESGRVLTQYAP